MNLMQWLSSLDELLYEVMSWILFFPVTLWKTLRRPLAMMEYAKDQLPKPTAEQYKDALSPPLFLVLSLLLTHGIALALGEKNTLAQQGGLAGLVHDDTSFLIFRTVIFGVFPLAMAVGLLVAKRVRLDRDTLQPVFYSQCYPTALFALAISLGGALVQLPNDLAKLSALLLIAGAIVAYWVVETVWFSRELGHAPAKGFWAASAAMLSSLTVFLGVGLLITAGHR